MLALSGLFVPIEALPAGLQYAAKLLPMTYIVSLLRGIWVGESWFVHLGDLAALARRLRGVHRDLGPGVSLGIAARR